MRWPPEAFWNATLADIHSAVTGYLESRGAKPAANDKAELYDELLELGREARRRERMDERERARASSEPERTPAP